MAFIIDCEAREIMYVVVAVSVLPQIIVRCHVLAPLLSANSGLIIMYYLYTLLINQITYIVSRPTVSLCIFNVYS